MDSRVRSILRFAPIALQFAALVAAIGVVSFVTPVTRQLVRQAEGTVAIPTPTRVFIEHTRAAKLIFASLFLVSIMTMVVTAAKIKDEADRVLVESVVFSVVWYIGIALLGGIVMAALLPHFALAAAAQ